MGHIIGRGRHASETYPSPPAAGGGFSAAAASNLDEGNGGATIVAGVATCDSDPFTTTNVGNAVDVQGTMQCQVDPGTTNTAFQILRDATPITAMIFGGTCLGNNVTVTLRVFDLPGAGPHTYHMRATPQDGGPIVSGFWQFVVAERQIVPV